jgi:hypothetical protein
MRNMPEIPFDSMPNLKAYYLERAIREGIDCSCLFDSRYNDEQQNALYQGIVWGVDVMKFADPTLSHHVLHELCLVEFERF